MVDGKKLLMNEQKIIKQHMKTLEKMLQVKEMIIQQVVSEIILTLEIIIK